MLTSKTIDIDFLVFLRDYSYFSNIFIFRFCIFFSIYIIYKIQRIKYSNTSRGKYVNWSKKKMQSYFFFCVILSVTYHANGRPQDAPNAPIPLGMYSFQHRFQ